MTGNGNTYNITATNVVNEVHDGGIGFQQNFGTLDLKAVLQQIVHAGENLRPRLSAADGQELGTAIEKIGMANTEKPRTLLPVLKSVMGIAGMAGEAGKSLFDAAAKAKDLIGL
ncbi:hypothetical protein [Promicromonospora sp. NPDC060271]|uniref:hypothetical protein n=1 Tax=Promicromonospora sp. NPDC060271 TaxID=3347089 RepID=UPI003668DB52